MERLHESRLEREIREREREGKTRDKQGRNKKRTNARQNKRIRGGTLTARERESRPEER